MRKFGAFLILIITATVVLSVTQSCNGFDSDDSDYRQHLSRLDSALQFRNKYYASRRNRIDSLRAQYEKTDSPEIVLPAMLEYVRLWKGISADSAIRFSNTGILLSIRARDSVYVQRFYSERAIALLCSGQIYDAIEDLNHIQSAGALPEVKEDFDRASFVIYFTLGTFYRARERQTDYLKYARKHLENLKGQCEENSPQWLYYRGFINLIDQNDELAREDFERVLALSDNDMNVYCRNALGYIHFNSGNLDDAATQLAMAARQNTVDANLYETSLFMLGETLSRMNETARASHYLNASLENSINGDMRFNLMRLNDVLLKVNASLERERSRRITSLGIMTIILAILLSIVLYMTLNKRREVKQLRRIERRLAQANIAKDTYIAEFMNLCSDYIDSLEAYNTLSKHKIATGQYEQLLAFMRSGKIIDEQREKFYEVFDKSILQLFPDYINNVNALLQPDKQIIPPKPDTLTTELRVLALTRLGINDVQAISRFLGISPNTIYTYRNKLRQRAVNRQTFDEDAKHIDAI